MGKCTAGVVVVHATLGDQLIEIQTKEVTWFIDEERKKFIDILAGMEDQKEWANWTDYTDIEFKINGFRIVTASGKTINVTTS